MTLMIGVPAAVLLGLIAGRRVWTGVLLGLIWYTCLAVQTAYLAHPGRTGFLGIDALRAVQGGAFGQYWIAQAIIIALMASGYWLADHVRGHLADRGEGRSR